MLSHAIKAQKEKEREWEDHSPCRIQKKSQLSRSSFKSFKSSSITTSSKVTFDDESLTVNEKRNLS